MKSKLEQRIAEQLLRDEGQKVDFQQSPLESVKKLKPKTSNKQLERNEQQALFAWARTSKYKVLKTSLFHSVVNEGKRHNGSQFTAAGLTSGVVDVHLDYPSRGYSKLAIEMKYGKMEVTHSQWLYMAELQHFGNGITCVCRSWEAARQFLIWYLDENNKAYYPVLGTIEIGGIFSKDKKILKMLNKNTLT